MRGLIEFMKMLNRLKINLVVSENSTIFDISKTINMQHEFFVNNNDTLLTLVRDEARRLKRKATKAELELVTLQNLDADNPYHCIYGKMTGYCYSERASELIGSCCTKLYQTKKKINAFRFDIKTADICDLPTSLNSRSFDYYFSPIEKFILLDENLQNGNAKRLVRFLNGTNKTLTLKKF